MSKTGAEEFGISTECVDGSRSDAPGKESLGLRASDSGKLRRFITDKATECLAHVGLRSQDIEVECHMDAASGHAIVLVDVWPHFATLWRYGPHVEAFVISRLARKYGVRVDKVRLHWCRGAAFTAEPEIQHAAGLYRALRNLGGAADTDPQTQQPGLDNSGEPLDVAPSFLPSRHSTYIVGQRAFTVVGEPDHVHGFKPTQPAGAAHAMLGRSRQGDGPASADRAAGQVVHSALSVAAEVTSQCE